MMRDQKVGVGARWRTRLQPKFLESDGALWNARRGLDLFRNTHPNVFLICSELYRPLVLVA